MKDLKIQWPGLGAKARLLRHQLGSTQERLGEQLGLSWMTIHRWETDSRGIRLSHLTKLCELAGVHVDNLLPGTSTPDLECLRCQQLDRVHQSSYKTDFGGTVVVMVCLRCGIIQTESFGDRPPDEFDRPSSLLEVRDTLRQTHCWHTSHGVALCCKCPARWESKTSKEPRK